MSFTPVPIVAVYVALGSSAYGSIAIVFDWSGTVTSVFTAAGDGEIVTWPATDFGSSGFENAMTGSPLAKRPPPSGLGAGVGTIASAS